MDNFKIVTNGVKLTPNQYSDIHLKLQLLEMVAPAQSTIIFKLQRIGLKIKGVITIKNFAKRFHASSSGACPKQVFYKLENDINHQLTLWKKNRFEKTFAVESNDRFEKQRTGGYAV
jgi:hypothetical protein